ncbi:hypothetical protein ES703_00327 [subsurface metagenome]
MKNFANLSKLSLNIHLYEDPSTKNLDLREIVSYLREKLGHVSVDLRGPFIKAGLGETEDLARRIAGTKVRDLTNPNVQFEPLPGEVEFERKLLRDSSLKLVGLLYDGFKLQAVLRELIPQGEFDIGHSHIAFTNRLFGTFDEGDRRYHARVSVYGFPSLISTTGIVEAPARPKEFYVLKQRYAALGGTDAQLEELKEKFRDRFIDYDDERLTEIMKGYVMQAVFYHLKLDPFCVDKRCRLWNAHWQEEMLEAQLSQPEFCEQHERELA